MSESVNLSVNGHSQVPPGFRFHPTEEELLHYYLRKKVASQKIDLDVIRDVDLNKLEPWDIQEKCRIGTTPQNDWYFFSHKDKKYPSGTRTNRATNAGFWKATGRDKMICSSLRRIGMRKTLVFYRGRAPHGLKSDWIMHEYRLDDNTSHDSTNGSNTGDSGPEEGWVVCRVFKKKNYHKALDGPLTASTSANDDVLGQILTYMGGRSSSSNSNYKQENQLSIINVNAQIIPEPVTSAAFAHLPELLELSHREYDYKPPVQDLLTNPIHEPNDWVALDRLVASQLNGQLYSADVDHELICSYNFSDQDLGFAFDHHHHDETELVKHMNSNPDIRNDGEDKVSSTDIDFWTGVRSPTSLQPSSSSDPLCHLSV